MGHPSTSDRGVCTETTTILKRSGSAVGSQSAPEVKSLSNGFTTNGIPLDDANHKKELAGQNPHHVDLESYTRNFKGDKVLGIQFEAPLKWDNIIAIFTVHVLFVVCIILLGHPIGNLKIRSVLWTMFTGGLAGFGVTAGAHRFWTHRSYKANTVLRSIMMLCYSLAGQNTLYDWVRDHRVHHKYSETDADPHNSNRGFFFAHVGWLMMHKHPEVLRRGRMIDMSDVLNDPVVQFHQKYFIILKIMVCFVLPTVFNVYCLGEDWMQAIMLHCIVRYVSSLNCTWSVNSAAHMWGSRPFDKRINPSENLFVSLCTMGEGWHNYHHVFPWDYKAAELGIYSVNLSTMFIDLFHKLGWAWGMKQPSKELVTRTIEKYGDGSHESQRTQSHSHFHIAEVPDPELDDAESSSTESSKLDENDNMHEKKKMRT